MGGGWRRAFCTSISKDKSENSSCASTKKIDKHQSSGGSSYNSLSTSTKPGGFFPNPSNPNLPTPTLRCRTTTVLANNTTPTPTWSLPNSPKSTQPKKFNTPRQLFQYLSTSDPSSPRSPSSTLSSLIKSTLQLSRNNRCEICSCSVKMGQGTAIFTSECNHVFHFPCVAAQAKSQSSNSLLACPVCGSTWSEPRLLPSTTTPTNHQKTSHHKKKHLRVYDDDEPLTFSSPAPRFVPIPETEEYDAESDSDNQQFQGFFFPNRTPAPSNKISPEVVILPESAVVSVGSIHQTRVVVLRVRAPLPPSPARGATRPPVDLVALLDVSENMSGGKSRALKQAMSSIVSSLGPTDRLSIVVFSSASKRLSPLRRMTPAGKSSARRILHALGATGPGMSVSDALKKAAKVIEDRTEKNPLASIVVISRAASHPPSTTHLSSRKEIPVRFIYLSESDPHALPKSVGDFLTVMCHDVKLQLGFTSGSCPAEVSAVYPLTGRTGVYSSGSVRVGNLHAGEERDFLVELKVPVSHGGGPPHVVLSILTYFKESSTGGLIAACKEQSVLVPRPQSVGIQRLRNVHVSTRAIAESRRVLERGGDVSGAYRLLNSARERLIRSAHGSASDCLRGLEVELDELNRRNYPAMDELRWPLLVEEKAGVLTPTSAWRAAERLAKVAIMRKHMNKVSDLHGFENARF